MKKWNVSIIAVLVVTVGLSGLVDLGSENVSATVVSGSQFDGSGGPWNLTRSPYFVVGNVTIPAGQTLTIEPGVEVRFDGYYRIYVDGNLTAVGNQFNRINLTSNSSAPAAGDWHGIQVNSSGHLELVFANVSFGNHSIHLDSGSRNKLSNNRLSSCKLYCLVLNNSSNNTIENNIVSSSANRGFSFGTSSNNNTVKGNIISSSAVGVLLSSSHGNDILNNSILGNDKSGLELVDSTYNTISNNVIPSNSGFGIALNQSSDRNTMTRNWIINNSVGLAINSSAGNLIHHNIFKENPVRALDDSDLNRWNDSYPSGGNYWSDYSPFCQELHNGSMTPQETGEPDGICDLQWDIDSDTADYYPLKTTESIDSPPAIEVFEPGGAPGQVHVQGDLIDIIWATNDDFPLPQNPINISYGSPSDGWKPIVYNETDDGQYSWDTSSVPCPKMHWVRLSVYDSIGQTAFGISNESFAFICPGDSPPIITLLEPGGNISQAFTRNDTVAVKWSTFDTNPLPPNPINITYGNIIFGWTQIATFEEDDGLFLWNTSGVLCPALYSMNITVFDSSSQMSYDMNTHDFAVLCVDPKPDVEVLEPGSTFGQKHTQGQDITIIWSASDNVLLPQFPINISYGSKASGWTTIATGEENDGTYSWDTSSVECPGIYWVNISVHDSRGQIVFDESEYSFNLFCPGDSVPIVEAYEPGSLAGQTILQGDIVEVTWFAVDDIDLPPDPINISYGNPTAGWTQVTAFEPNDGNHSWNTSGVQCPGSFWINISARDSIGQISYDEGNYSFSVTCHVTDGGFNGTVMDSNGDPISSATILLLNATGAVVNSTISNATGGFNFTGICQGTYNLIVQKGGYKNASKGPVTVVAGSFFDSGSVVLEANATIRGRVVDEDGKPIQSAVVELLDSNLQVIKSTTANGNGNFSFDELGYGIYMIRASAEGFESNNTGSLTVHRLNLNLTLPNIILTKIYVPPAEEQYDWTPVILVIIIVVVLFLLMLMFLTKMRKGKDTDEPERPEDETASESPEESEDEEVSEAELPEDDEIEEIKE